MIDFIASISWFGWALIALAGITLWLLPSIIREWWRKTPLENHKMLPGQDPPIYHRPDDS